MRVGLINNKGLQDAKNCRPMPSIKQPIQYINNPNPPAPPPPRQIQPCKPLGIWFALGLAMIASAPIWYLIFKLLGINI